MQCNGPCVVCSDTCFPVIDVSPDTCALGISYQVNWPIFSGTICALYSRRQTSARACQTPSNYYCLLSRRSCPAFLIPPLALCLDLFDQELHSLIAGSFDPFCRPASPAPSVAGAFSPSSFFPPIPQARSPTPWRSLSVPRPLLAPLAEISSAQGGTL